MTVAFPTLLLLLVHAAATWAMTGLIWFIQIVHYPLFEKVGAESFAEYEGHHSALTTFVVAPLMLVELVTALILIFDPPEGVGRAWTLAGAALVGVIWLSTFALSVPQHAILENGFDAGAWQKLVSTNWIRTIAWSLRALLVLWLIAAHRPFDGSASLR